MAKDKSVVFYSWQTDLPGATNRNFILQALEIAAKKLRQDASLLVEPVVDRDTLDVPGSPNISETIFGKIDQAQIFVCDVSIINQDAREHNPDARLTPNPNVLIELGYALKRLGDKHIIMVFNDAYGTPEQLPFDLRMRRVTRYHMSVDNQDRASERKALEGKLIEALDSTLRNISPTGELILPLSKAEQARKEIESGQENKAAISVRQSMSELANSIAEKTPVYPTNNPLLFVNGDLDKLLLQTLDELQATVLEFAQLAETIAQANAVEPARVMYKGFENILNLYTLASPRVTLTPRPDHDLARFLGHELFVMFFALLIREGRWELIADLFEDDLYARGEDYRPPTSVPFYRLSATPVSFNQEQLLYLKPKSPSYHADVLQERHTQGDLAKYVPIEQFAEADYFLYLRAQLQETENPDKSARWWPWSWPYLQHAPRYLQEARRVRFAKKLLRPLGVERITDFISLQLLLTQRTRPLTQILTNGPWRYAMAGFDFGTIGSE